MSLNLTEESERSYKNRVFNESIPEQIPDEKTPLLGYLTAPGQDCEENESTKLSGPDGLEAWLVALAACFIHFIMAGLIRTSGIFYVDFIDYFHVDRGRASLPFALRSAMRNFFGPVVGILGQKYGIRTIMITGGVIGSISAASCFYLNDITWITVVWGGINGLAASLITTLPQVAIGQHFKKYRTTASGMGFSGGCFGSLLFPVLVEYLLIKYSVSGTFLILSGILMHVIPASIIIKTPSWWEREKKPVIKISTVQCRAGTMNKEITAEERTKVKCADNIVNEHYSNNIVTENRKISEVNNDESLRRYQSLNNVINTDYLWENRDVLVRLLTAESTFTNNHAEDNKYCEFSINDAFIQEVEIFFKNLVPCKPDETFTTGSNYNHIVNHDTESADKTDGVHFINGDVQFHQVNAPLKLLSIKPIFICLQNLFYKDRKSLVALFSEKQESTVNNILEDLGHLYNALACYTQKDNIHIWNSDLLGESLNSIESCAVKSNTFSFHIKTALILHKKPIFILICLCRSLHFLMFMTVITIIVDFVKDKGLLTEDGKYVIMAFSCGDLMGRLLFGWITDKDYVTLPRFMLCIMVLHGLVTISLPFMVSKAAIMTSIAVFALLQGSVFVRHPVLVVRYLRSHEQSIAMGCINFFSGFIGIIMPFYIGHFRDVIGSYNGVFFINGAIGAIVGLLWLFEPFFSGRSSRSHSKNDQKTSV